MVTFTDKELKILWSALDYYKKERGYLLENSKESLNRIREKLSDNYRANS